MGACLRRRADVFVVHWGVSTLLPGGEEAQEECTLTYSDSWRAPIHLFKIRLVSEGGGTGLDGTAFTAE